jgi:hypothetical protein
MLASTLPIIDAWCVDVCPESTDGTAEVVRRFFQERAPHLPGYIASSPPQKPSHMGRCRTLGFQAAERLGTDYVIWIDADDELVVDRGFRKDLLTDHVYEILVQSGPVAFPRPHLVRARFGCTFKEPAHEYLDHGQGIPKTLPGISIRRNIDGNQGDERPRYKRDADRLAAYLKEEPNNARSWFYLGQCLRDAGELQASLGAYAHRADMTNGFWEERAQARLEMLSLLVRLGRFQDIPDVLEETVSFHPPRSPEALWRVAMWKEQAGDLRGALDLLNRAGERPVPSDRLFVDRTLYEWRITQKRAELFERFGASGEAMTLYKRLYASPSSPAHVRIAAFNKLIRLAAA